MLVTRDHGDYDVIVILEQSHDPVVELGHIPGEVRDAREHARRDVTGNEHLEEDKGGGTVTQGSFFVE